MKLRGRVVPLALAPLLGACGAGVGGRPPIPPSAGQSAAAADDAARRRLLPDGQGSAWTRAAASGTDIVRWREQVRACELGAGGFGPSDAEEALGRFAVSLRANGELVNETTLSERQRSYVVRPAGTPAGEAHVIITTVVADPRSTIAAFMSRRPAAPPRQS
jgi:hypothetical protein